MTEITHAKALRAIAAARRIEADRNAGPWHVVGGAHNTDIRDSADRVCAEWWGLPGNSIAICLWAGTFGALLDVAQWALGVGDWEIVTEDTKVVPWLKPHFTVLIETLDRVQPDWDKEAQ